MDKEQHKPISTQGLLDIVLFFSIFWMILFRNNSTYTTKTNCNRGRNRNPNGRTRARGLWRPNIMYVPLLLLRWVFVPHRDWVKEHAHYYDDDHVNQPYQHHNHHPNHQHQHHRYDHIRDNHNSNNHFTVARQDSSHLSDGDIQVYNI